MPQTPIDTLRREALKRCKEHMNRLIDAGLEIVPAQSELEWDANLQRHVFHQDFVVWRDFDKVEARTFPDGAIRELRIHGRFAKPDELTGLPKLSDAEVLSIAGTTGLLGDTAMVERVSQDQIGMVNAEILQIEHGLPRSLSVTINPKTKQVAAFRVLKTA